MNLLHKCLILSHRYLGIPLSALFIVWFVSGIAMMYSGGMPSLTPELRLERAAALDPSRVALAPIEAAERAGLASTIGNLTLVSLLGRPAYRFRGFRGATTVFADTGEPLAEIDAARAIAIAGAFAGVAANRVAFVRTVTEPDQWTLTETRSLPLHMLRIDDDAGSVVYVSPNTGEVSLVTTRASRTLAWFGAIPHWFYFTALRTNQPLWYWSVVWASAIGCVLAVMGLILGFTQFRRTRPFRLSASIPYRGWMRWHYLLGTVFGLFALTWVFSGLLSMEPFAWTRATGIDVPREAFSGGSIDLAEYPLVDAAAWNTALAGRDIKELEFVRIQDEPYYLARVSAAADARLQSEREHQPYPLAAGDRSNELLIGARDLRIRREPFAAEALIDRLRAAVPDAAIVDQTLLNEYDSYYYARDRRAPLPVLRVKFDDLAATWVYIDPRRAELVAQTHRASRVERWLFNGLHSLDFAFWYDRRPAWDIGMILLSLGALATSAVGMYLGIKRLRRDAARMLGG
jgi:hypothetical protein